LHVRSDGVCPHYHVSSLRYDVRPHYGVTHHIMRFIHISFLFTHISIYLHSYLLIYLYIFNLYYSYISESHHVTSCDLFIGVKWLIHILIWFNHSVTSRHTYERVTSHVWMSHVKHLNEWRHTYEWVTSHTWMSHVTHMNESRHTYEWVTSHIWMSHVPHMNESSHLMRVCEWVTHMNKSHIWMSHTYEWVTHMKESHTKSNSQKLDSSLPLVRACDMTYVWQDSFICVTWLVHMCDMTHAYVWHDSFMCLTWLVPKCDMTNSYVWHDSCICVTWIIHVCVMNRS